MKRAREPTQGRDAGLAAMGAERRVQHVRLNSAELVGVFTAR